MRKLNKWCLRKQWKWSEFSPKRQSCLFWSGLFWLMKCYNNTFYSGNEQWQKNPYATHHDELGYGTHETIQKCVTSVSRLKLRLKVCMIRTDYQWFKNLSLFLIHLLCAMLLIILLCAIWLDIFRRFSAMCSKWHFGQKWVMHTVGKGIKCSIYCWRFHLPIVSQ